MFAKTKIDSMKKVYVLLAFILILSFHSNANPGDTIRVQTFTYGSPQNAWFTFPSDTNRYEKIFMKYNLKCNPAQSPACGEWDYLTYTYLYDHTHTYDSTLLNHANFWVNNSFPDSFSYSNSPTYQLQPRWETYVVHDDTLSYNSTTIANGTDSSLYPLDAFNPVSRTFYLWTANELTAAGLTAGNISGLQWHLLNNGSVLQGLTIRMMNSSLTDFSANTYSFTGLQTVYSQTTWTASYQWNSLQFTQPFNWDGTSNILIEVTYNNNAPHNGSWVQTENTSWNSSSYSAGFDKSLYFSQPDQEVAPANNLSSIDSFITVSFWAFGDTALEPVDGTCFEAVDAAGHRILNSHTPWSNSNVYWDAGNATGYDRINAAATTTQTEGQWNYWTFEKNVANGTMTIFLNGVQWLNGTGKTKPMGTIDHFKIGQGNWNGSQSFAGNIDEFAVWDTVLPVSVIQQYMYKDLDGSHPFSGHLKMYLQHNDGNNFTETETVTNQHSQLLGASSQTIPAQNLFRNFNNNSSRPNIVFEKGTYTSHIDSILFIDTVWNTPIGVVLFNDLLHPATATDTQYVWPANYYSYLYNNNGQIFDSLYVSADTTIHKLITPYYSAPFEVVNRFEIGRYITPYGNGLSLGNGWTWTYDVSDYAPLLHDSVQLSAGNWQELLDVQFWMIEGTPPRDPIRVTNMWNGDFWYGTNTPWDTLVKPFSMLIPTDAANTRIKIRTTGHGGGGNQNCSEFCPKVHYLNLNGTDVWQHLVWRDNCSLNPLYPQGGTWVYQRANWCHGAEVWTYDFELTPLVTAGNSYNMDYNAQPYTWNGAGSTPNFVTEVQRIDYTAPNYSLDAAIEDVLSPSGDQMWKRDNPICGHPIIKIKNTGSTTLTSLMISYGIQGAVQSQYLWTGSLAFMHDTTITLGQFDWTPASNTFVVTCSQPNGGADQYAQNNTVKTTYNFPSQLPNQFVLELKTNLFPSENYLEVKDTWGNVVFSRQPTGQNTIYRDTLNLPDGCYELFLHDYDEDGLSWWANNDGAGFFRIRSAIAPTVLMQFGADFGALIYQQFTIGAYNSVQNPFPVFNNQLVVYPNPAESEFYVDLGLKEGVNATLDMMDITGKLIWSNQYPNGGRQSETIHLNQIPGGIYFFILHSAEGNLVRKVIVQK